LCLPLERHSELTFCVRKVRPLRFTMLLLAKTDGEGLIMLWVNVKSIIFEPNKPSVEGWGRGRGLGKEVWFIVVMGGLTLKREELTLKLEENNQTLKSK